MFPSALYLFSDLNKAVGLVALGTNSTKALTQNQNLRNIFILITLNNHVSKSKNSVKEKRKMYQQKCVYCYLFRGSNFIPTFILYLHLAQVL